MKLKILKMQRSSRSLPLTKLTAAGPVTAETPLNTEAFEMVIDYYVEDSDVMPSNSIIVSNVHYANLIEKYTIPVLLKGVHVDSIFDVINAEPEEIVETLKKEAEKIANSIVSKIEADSLFNNYHPDKLREFIEVKIMGLRDKFQLEAKF